MKTVSVAFALVFLAACSAQDPLHGTALQEAVAAELETLEADSSLFAKDLKSGREIAVRADVPMNTVSVIKIAIMVAAYRDADAGSLDLDARYTIRSEDLRPGSGVLKRFAVGLQPTFRDLLTQMIISSDNTATDILIAKLGIERVNSMLASLGYRETRLRTTIAQLFRGAWITVDAANAGLTDEQVFERSYPKELRSAVAYVQDPDHWFGRSTAREMARFLEQLERGELASPHSTQEMRNILQWQIYYSRIPQRIRYRVDIGHKTGDWPPVLGNDVGILYAEHGPIVIAVFTNGNSGNFADLEATIGRVTEKTLNAWTDSGR